MSKDEAQDQTVTAFLDKHPNGTVAYQGKKILVVGMDYLIGFEEFPQKGRGIVDVDATMSGFTNCCWYRDRGEYFFAYHNIRTNTPFVRLASYPGYKIRGVRGLRLSICPYIVQFYLRRQLRFTERHKNE